MHAGVAELADAYGSGPYGGNPVKVQVLSPAPRTLRPSGAFFVTARARFGSRGCPPVCETRPLKSWLNLLSASQRHALPVERRAEDRPPFVFGDRICGRVTTPSRTSPRIRSSSSCAGAAGVRICGLAGLGVVTSPRVRSSRAGGSTPFARETRLPGSVEPVYAPRGQPRPNLHFSRRIGPQ